MNIIILAENFNTGGINRNNLDLAQGLQRYSDVNVSLVALSDRTNRWLLQEAAARKIPVEVLPMRSVFDLQVIPRLRRLLVGQQTDILHSNAYRGNIIARLAVRGGRMPTKLVCTVHGVYHFPSAPLRSRLYYALDYLTMRMTDRAIVISETTLKQISRLGLGNKARVVLNGTAIPPLANSEDQRASRQALEISLDARVVLFVGRLSPEKGIQTLAEVARKILASREDVVFLIVGDGEAASELISAAKDFGSRLVLAGGQRDVSPFYAAADLLFMPSRSEGLPLTLIEAFARGITAVASNVGGIPEIVRDGVNGFLCNPTNVTQMYERILQLLEDDTLRRSFSIQARNMVEANFSLERMISETYQVYRSLVQSGSA